MHGKLDGHGVGLDKKRLEKRVETAVESLCLCGLACGSSLEHGNQLSHHEIGSHADDPLCAASDKGQRHAVIPAGNEVVLPEPLPQL